MLELLVLLLRTLRTAMLARTDLAIENLALRQQLAVLSHRGGRRRRARMRNGDRLFWVLLRRVWSRWSEALVVVKPETVVRWHRAGFRRVLDEVVSSLEAKRRSASHREGHSRPRTTHGDGEPELGRATHPR